MHFKIAVRPVALSFQALHVKENKVLFKKLLQILPKKSLKSYNRIVTADIAQKDSSGPEYFSAQKSQSYGTYMSLN